MEASNGRPPPSPSTVISSVVSDGGETVADQVMSEVHLGCPPNLSGPYISHFTIAIPPEYELTERRYDCNVEGGSTRHEIGLDDDGDLVLSRRSKQDKNKLVMSIQHNITSSIPSVGLQVWRAELVLADFVCHKMFTSSEFHGIVAIELGAGTGLVGLLLARVAQSVFVTDHGAEVLENCDKNVDLNSVLLPHKDVVLVRELDWMMSWPPRLVPDSLSQPRYGWKLSEVERVHNASLLLAADVIYSDDLTDAFFSTLEALMSQGSEKVLCMALEKRYNFTMDDLNVVANGYSRFRSYVRDEGECCDFQNGSSSCFVGTSIDLAEIPQYVRNYERGQDVELWKIKYVKTQEYKFNRVYVGIEK